MDQKLCRMVKYIFPSGTPWNPRRFSIQISGSVNFSTVDSSPPHLSLLIVVWIIRTTQPVAGNIVYRYRIVRQGFHPAKGPALHAFKSLELRLAGPAAVPREVAHEFFKI